jgi:hypothetical protein
MFGPSQRSLADGKKSIHAGFNARKMLHLARQRHAVVSHGDA